MPLEVHDVHNVNGGVGFSDLCWEFRIPLIWFVRQMVWVTALACPRCQGTRFTSKLESVNANKEGVVEGVDDGSNTAAEVVRIDVNVVYSAVPVGFFTVGQSSTNCVALLNDIVVVAGVK